MRDKTLSYKTNADLNFEVKQTFPLEMLLKKALINIYEAK